MNTEDDVAFIQALAALLKSSDLHEIEVERTYGGDDELKVRLSRQSSQPMATVAPAITAAPAVVSAPMEPVTAVTGAAAPATAAQADAAPDLSNAVTSPMVGTAYLAPEPGAGNFVKVGDTVQEGQTILIIEAMKTMNQIPAPRAGTVRSILVDNAEPVEFGEPLMIVE